MFEKTGARSQNSEDGMRKPEVGRRKAETGIRKAEVGILHYGFEG